ncbi:MAG: DsrE family protein [Ancrocorticia sp.]|uniref:DsrE family protein n=1 Tax=Ancrocorticia sp. TaxID=2593684 RepID=UPI003F9330FB
MTDVVFHIDEDARWEQLLNNLEYYSANFGETSKIEVVINGPAVRPFNGFDVNPERGKRIRALADAGVRFTICASSLHNRQIGEENIPSDFIAIVPQGIAELVARQGDGFAYIKP